MADLTGQSFADIFPKLLQDPGDGTIQKSDGTEGASGKASLSGGNTFAGVQNFEEMPQIGGESIYDPDTYLPTLTPSSSGTITLATAWNTLSYRVFFDMLVNVSGFLVVDSVSSPVGRINLSLPFPVANDPKGRSDSTGVVLMDVVNAANISDFAVQIVRNTTEARIFLADAVSLQSDSAQEVKSNTRITVNLWFPI